MVRAVAINDTLCVRPGQRTSNQQKKTRISIRKATVKGPFSAAASLLGKSSKFQEIGGLTGETATTSHTACVYHL